MDPFGAQAPLLTFPQIQSLLRIEFARARRYSYPLCCLVARIDGLERLRDVHGAGFRDDVLRRVIRAIQSQARTSDAIGLYQERIVLILPHTPPAGAAVVAERLREAASSETFRVGEVELRITVSVGLAAFQEHGTIFFDSILKAAETALAQATAAGGDRVETAPTGAPPAAG